MKSCPTPKLSLPKGFISGLAICFEVGAPFRHWHCLARDPEAVTVSRSESTHLLSKSILQERTPTFGDMERWFCNEMNLIWCSYLKSKQQTIKCKDQSASLYIRTFTTATLGTMLMLTQRNLHRSGSQTQPQTSTLKFSDNSIPIRGRSRGPEVKQQQLLISHLKYRLSPQSVRLDHRSQF